MRELRVEDALLYLDQVKVEFGDRPHIYNEFLDIMKTFKTQQIDTPGVIRRVSNLFQGNKKLVLGFNTFLPEGYKIELPLDGDGPPIAVFRAPGETVTHILSGPGAPPAAPAAMPPADGQNAAAAPPPNAAAAPGVAFPPRQVQSPLRQGLPMGHGAPGLGERGPLGQQQAGLGAAPPGQAAAYPQSAVHLAQGGRDARPQLGQGPHSMAIDAGARARLEQQARAGVGMQGQVQAAPAPRPGLSNMGSAQQKLSPDSKVPARIGRGGLGGPAHHQMGMQPAQQQQPPPPPQQPPQPPQQQQQQPGMEFDHAINYVTTIKKRFSSDPETYKKFLEILHTYQKEQRGIKEVLEEVSSLFSEHPDLLKEFTYFLPDAVQAEAKVQLEQAAKEAEARKRAKASKQTMMQQAQGMQRQPPVAQPPAPSPPQETPEVPHPPPRPTSNIPFGATMGRSRERESEIYRSAVYGTISFAPVRPPRKNTPTVAQSAAKNGRPTMLPPLPRQPNTAESSFFEKAKRHLNRKELAPDKPSATRARHTPYMEFLKCLHLFGTGVLNKDELVLLLRGLFIQGHAPKSGVNIGGGASNPRIAIDAQDLLKEFEEVWSRLGTHGMTLW